jgi:predicted transcriptional regulator
MTSIDEQILKTTKEIVVKFIETGRLSPSGFGETFKSVYRTVEKTVKGKRPQVVESPKPAK